MAGSTCSSTTSAPRTFVSTGSSPRATRTSRARSGRAGRLQPVHELGRVDSQAPGDLQQVVQAEVAPAALDLPEERPMDGAPVGQRLLTEPEAFAPLAHAAAEQARGIGERLGHGMSTPSDSDCLCPEQIGLMHLSPNYSYPGRVRVPTRRGGGGGGPPPPAPPTRCPPPLNSSPVAPPRQRH